MSLLELLLHILYKVVAGTDLSYIYESQILPLADIALYVPIVLLC